MGTKKSKDDVKEVKPYTSYSQYLESLFVVINQSVDVCLTQMKQLLATGQGQYKNVLYPDIEVAHDVCKEKLAGYYNDTTGGTDDETSDEDVLSAFSGEEEEIGDELASLLNAFAMDDSEDDFLSKNPLLGGDEEDDKETPATSSDPNDERIRRINERAEATLEAGIKLPFYELCKKLEYEPFTMFTLACGILATTQTDYSSIFQVINGNGNFVAPTIESAAKLYYGTAFSINSAFSEMSVCLEQLQPILPLQVNPGMPFSTLVSLDKRVIDFLFGSNPLKPDENYSRFFRVLYDGTEELNPIMANQTVLEAMEISYDQGVRLFAYFGDEGSGRKFFVKQFCAKRNMRSVAMNCKKLFGYDGSTVERGLWALTRECILTNACCVLEELAYREEEKDRFFSYVEQAFTRLTDKKVLVFANSKDNINYKEVTKERLTTLDIPTPNIEERLKCWEYFSQGYNMAEECDLFEMTNKFLFTPGKIHDAIVHAQSVSVMAKEESISRASLFKGCNAQMSTELSQKATRVEAKFGLEDIVMNKDQRETIDHVIEQMNFKKQVYEDWNYTKKYPYGRGLTVLLYGAPGTGKSMMAQVLAHELHLELYRVDISKVVDKYVGETEKSLSMIFREAKKCNVVLFFDECDTIFAKRSDDGGSNQSSNNNKTALLLQEMEAYDGVCVLATNYKHNIDPAFFRRMKYVIEFQFPDPDTREMLWRTTVPKTTPLDGDVDFRFIAEKYEFAGGNIKNCILNAAFLAAADETANGKVCMRHYLNAIKYEFVKTGKVFTRADFEPYADEVFSED